MAMNSNVPTTSSVMSSTRLSSNVAAANNMFHHRHHDSSAAQALSQQQYMSANSHNLVVSILLCNTESKATTKDICQTNFHFIPLLNIKTRCYFASNCLQLNQLEISNVTVCDSQFCDFRNVIFMLMLRTRITDTNLTHRQTPSHPYSLPKSKLTE